MSSRIVPTILSRPVYGTLTPTTASAHLLIADADGGTAILDLAKAAPAGFFDSAEVCYVPGADADFSDELQQLSPRQFHTSPTIQALLPRLSRTFERLHMGTSVYLAGSESLIGLATQSAMQAGLDYQALQTEHRGTLARRVQCVHCKGTTENVTTQPAECAHCGLLLFVRDHYSRRLAAFQGVNINAEDPTDVPPKIEEFT